MPITCPSYWNASVVLPSPEEVWSDFPTSAEQRAFRDQSRQIVRDIIEGKDPRFLLVVGPCSIHDRVAGIEYATKLKHLATETADTLFIVMRAHFEKPRTTTGWKGLLYDPDLDGSHNIAKGISESRQFLLTLAEMQLPAATEFLDPATPCYLSDLITWGSVGARTTSSQVHRQMVSGLPMPVGFKNGIDGSLSSAINSVLAANTPHAFMRINAQGRLATVSTTGNPYTHIVLRGGESGPNYAPEAVDDATQQLVKMGIPPRLMIDCSHDNCGKKHERQISVLASVVDQVSSGNEVIFGALLESYLSAGSQPFPRNRDDIRGSMSLTDPCIDWETTAQVITQAHEKLKANCLAWC